MSKERRRRQTPYQAGYRNGKMIKLCDATWQDNMRVKRNGLVDRGRNAEEAMQVATQNEIGGQYSSGGSGQKGPKQ